MRQAPFSTASSPPYAKTMSSRVFSSMAEISRSFWSFRASALSEKMPVKLFVVPSPLTICWEIFLRRETLMFRITSAW